jgi:hypothetical protein
MFLYIKHYIFRERSLKGIMTTYLEQFPVTNPNPVISVANDSTVLYSNDVGEPLLHEWGVAVGEKLHSSILDLFCRIEFSFEAACLVVYPPYPNKNV